MSTDMLGPDLVSRFIAKSQTEQCPVSTEDVRDIVMNFLIAGRDTTACALSWQVAHFWKAFFYVYASPLVL